MEMKLVAKNTLLQLFSRVASAALSFALTFILARQLGAHFFGEYTKILSYVLLFYFFIDLGINAFFLQHVEKKNTQLEHLFAELVGLRLVLSLLVGVIACGLAFFLSGITTGFTNLVLFGIALGSVTLPFYAVQLSTIAVFQYRMNYAPALAAGIGGPLVWLVVLGGAALFVPEPENLISVALIGFVLNSVVAAGISLLAVRRLITVRLPAFAFQHMLHIFQESIPYGLVLFINLLYFRLDVWILAHFRTSSEIGAYALAYKFFEFAIALPTFVMNSLYPLLLKRGWQNKEQPIRFGLVLFAGSFLLVALFWLAAPLLVFIRPDYASSVGLLRILALSIPIFFLTSPLLWHLLLKGKQKQLLWVYLPALVITILGNWFLVPYLGASAAAGLTGVGEGVVLLLLLVLVIRN